MSRVILCLFVSGCVLPPYPVSENRDAQCDWCVISDDAGYYDANIPRHDAGHLMGDAGSHLSHDAGEPDSGPQCSPGLTYCGIDCVDVQTDTDNCGRCGNSCGTCSAGQCVACSPEGTVCVGGAVNPSLCTVPCCSGFVWQVSAQNLVCSTCGAAGQSCNTIQGSHLCCTQHCDINGRCT